MMGSTTPPVDVFRILDSNIVPNAEEATAIQGEIDTLTQSIGKLQKKVQELEIKVQRRRAALSPIRRLPLEILGEIFRFFAFSEWSGYRSRSVLCLRLVCKRWSQVTPPPEIWGERYINTDSTEATYLSVLEQFERAKSAKKTLGLEFEDDPCNCPDRPEMCSLGTIALKKFMSTGPHLSHLQISCATPHCMKNLATALRVSFASESAANLSTSGLEIGMTASPTRPWDSLTSLGLTISHVRQENIDDIRSLASHLPPNITSLYLSYPEWEDVYFTEEPPRSAVFNIPPSLLSRLQKFKLFCNWPGTHILEMLQHLDNAEKVSIIEGLEDISHHTPWSDLLRHPSGSRLLLPKVKYLHLGYASSIDILDLLDVPNLYHLRIGMVNQSTLTTVRPLRLWKPILDLVKSSPEPPALRVLQLYDVHVPEIELIDTLRDLPFITSLIIDKGTGVSGDHRTFWYTLIRKAREAVEADQGWYLPKLENLELLNASPDFAYSLVAGFLRQRKNASPDTTPDCLWTLSYTPGGSRPVSEVYLKHSVNELGRSGVCARLLPGNTIGFRL